MLLNSELCPKANISTTHFTKLYDTAHEVFVSISAVFICYIYIYSILYYLLKSILIYVFICEAHCICICILLDLASFL